jgi:hypothetical protein
MNKRVASGEWRVARGEGREESSQRLGIGNGRRKDEGGRMKDELITYSVLRTLNCEPKKVAIGCKL